MDLERRTEGQRLSADYTDYAEKTFSHEKAQEAQKGIAKPGSTRIEPIILKNRSDFSLSLLCLFVANSYLCNLRNLWIMISSS